MGKLWITGPILPACDAVVQSMKMEVSENLQDNLSERLSIADVVYYSENIQNNLSDSLSIGVSEYYSEDLQDNLSESMTITNT